MITWIIVLPLALAGVIACVPRSQGKLLMAMTWNCLLNDENPHLLVGVDGISIFLIWLALAIIPACILAS